MAMWAQFATTFRFSLRSVMTKPIRAALFGAAGGPVAFLVGDRLGAVILLPPLVPGLLRLSISVDLDYFFADDRKHRPFAIVRRAARQRFPEVPGRRDPAYHFESLTFPVAEPKCEAYVATFHPVAGGKARPHELAGVEVVYVLSGELGVTVENAEHSLESGDAMYFDASVPHSYRRTGRTAFSTLIITVA